MKEGDAETETANEFWRLGILLMLYLSPLWKSWLERVSCLSPEAGVNEGWGEEWGEGGGGGGGVGSNRTEEKEKKEEGEGRGGTSVEIECQGAMFSPPAFPWLQGNSGE